MTRLLGAVLAGGAARRFGSDKALATLAGRSLVEHVVAALAPQVAAVVICGRAPGLADRPRPGLGPLGGLAAALRHALDNGFDEVLSVPCDAPQLPPDLAAQLSSPGYVRAMPVIGRWPAALSPRLDAHLAAGGSRSMRGWAAACGAVAADLPPIANVNTPGDLALLLRS